MRHVCDRIAVMYLGKIVELADADALFEHPRHPYTGALLSAVPVPDPRLAKGKQRQVLGGDVPSPTNPPPACRFHTRCPKAKDGVCNVEEPLLEPKDGGNLAACHFPLTDQEIARARPDRGGVSAGRPGRGRARAGGRRRRDPRVPRGRAHGAGRGGGGRLRGRADLQVARVPRRRARRCS